MVGSVTTVSTPAPTSAAAFSGSIAFQAELIWRRARELGARTTSQRPTVTAQR
jgi:hypothetical protein